MRKSHFIISHKNPSFDNNSQFSHNFAAFLAFTPIKWNKNSRDEGKSASRKAQIAFTCHEILRTRRWWKIYFTKCLHTFSSSAEVWCWNDDVNRDGVAMECTESVQSMKKGAATDGNVIAKRWDLNKKSSEIQPASRRRQVEVQTKWTLIKLFKETILNRDDGKPMNLAWKAVGRV